MPELPSIGARESQDLEFKAAEALRSPAGRRKLMREVVGMLNAGGGRILIGVQEEHGAFTGLDPLTDEDRPHESSLRDVLVDAIEPRVEDAEARLHWITVPGGAVLELRVRPREPRPQPPFCLRDGDARRYLVRAGDRLRAMTYADLMPADKNMEAAQQHESWFPQVVETAESWFDLKLGPSFFLVLGLQPRDQRKDLRLPDTAPAIINNPPTELARPNGWSFVTAFPGSAKWFKARRILLNGLEEQGYRQIHADHQGVFACRTLLEHLQNDFPENWRQQHPRAPGMLYPYALIETTVSVLRLAAHLWREHLHDADVHLLLRLTRTGGWLLPPYGPRALGYLHLDRWHAADEESIASGPHRIDADSFAANPDSLALVLLEDVYAEFDFTPDRIPCFDRQTRRFQPPR